MNLHRGQRFRMQDRVWRVLYVNASRAHCVTTVRVLVTIITNRRSGLLRTFQAKRRISIDIAPTSGVEVLAELELGKARVRVARGDRSTQ